MTEDEPVISNQYIGDSAGTVIQVGVVHGELTVHTGPPRPENTLLVSVTTTGPRYLCHYHRSSRRPEHEVHLFVEAFTAQAVILHRLRPVVLRTIHQYKVERLYLMEMMRRNFRAELDPPQPTLYGAGLDEQALQLDQSRSARKNDFPFYVTASDPEYFIVSPEARHSGMHLIEWRLELDWSSLGQHGTVVIDNRGDPFLFSPGGVVRRP